MAMTRKGYPIAREILVKRDDRSRIGILNRCLLPACGTVEAYADGGKSDPRRKQASVMYRSGNAEKAS